MPDAALARWVLGLRSLIYGTGFIFFACGPSRLSVGDQFTLEVGESVSIADLNLWLHFIEVAADSRCPTGANCIVAGDASVVIEVAPTSGDARLDSLHTTSGPKTLALDRADLLLVRLDPYPMVGAPIPPGEYVVTLTTRWAPVP